MKGEINMANAIIGFATLVMAFCAGVRIF